MKAAIIGSRSFVDYEYLKEKLSGLPISHIISGGAKGADSLAEKYAIEHNIPITVIKPDYTKNGKSATHIRNRDIVNSSDTVIAFWNGKPGGTKSVIAFAENSGKPVMMNLTPDIEEFSRKVILGEPQGQEVVRQMYNTLDFSSDGGRKLKVLKEQIIKSGQYGLFHSYVEENFDPEKFKHFKGKDNIFIAVPSTTGKNRFPKAFAEKLQKTFGGEAFIENHIKPSHEEQSKNLDGLQKIVQHREYVIIDPRLSAERLQGKNIVLVDDVATTGASIDGMREALYAKNIKVNAIATLCQSELRLATERDFERIAEKAAEDHPDTSLPLEKRIEDIAQKLEQCFEGCLKHKMNYLERDITGSSSFRSQNRKEFYNVLTGEIERIRSHGQRILPVLLQKRPETELDKGEVGRASRISRPEALGGTQKSEFGVRKYDAPTEGGTSPKVKEDGGRGGIDREAGVGGRSSPGQESINFRMGKLMEADIQLDMFGDLFSDPNEETAILTEVRNHESMGKNGENPLEEISSRDVPEIPGPGNTGTGIDEGRRSGSGNDGGINRERLPEERSAGDNASAIDSAYPGIRPAGILRNGHTDDRGNYHITPDDFIGKGGKVAKFNDNLSAILLLKQLESEKRNASPEEQSILVKYTGWGGLQEAFKQDLEGPWLERQKQLKTALNDSEYRSASRSTINAHYTSPEVAKAVWNGACRLGYAGGPTMEPATGIGHFFGLRPTHLPIEMHGIELDSISGRLAQQLYQSADIKVSAYENILAEKDRYNLHISNVPFADIKPYEEKKNQTPGLDNRYSLHDFYFLKSLYATRPGGLCAFITSRYTMDKVDTEVRSKIAGTADFIGAIRLPDNSFREIANTEVVTDIVFLQKRLDDQPMSELTKSFIGISPISFPSKDGADPINIPVNNYFVEHPEMILGTPELTGTMYRGNEYTVSNAGELAPLLETAIANLPENIMSIMVDDRTKAADTFEPLSHIKPENLPRGSFIVGLDNRLYQKDIETGKIELSELYNKDNSNRDSIERIMKMVTIKECVKDAIDNYYNEQPLEVHRNLSRLNSLYDNYVLVNGFLNNKRNASLIALDPDSALLCSLEKWDPKTKTAQKADIFKGIDFVRKPQVTAVETASDAMVLSLSRYGNLNLPFMESISGIERENLVTQLSSTGFIYQDPHELLVNKRTAFLTSDEYLSGNIRVKLEEAKTAAALDPVTFSKHVGALETILPKDLGSEDISVRMNSPIVGAKHVENFIEELLQTTRFSVSHIPINGKWEISGHCYSTQNLETYGTSDLTALKIIDYTMNGRPIKVYDKGVDDKPILNLDKTAAAENKAEIINNEFQKWIWKDADRTKDIVDRYNQVYNSHVERKFTHPERLLNPDAEIRFHGCNFPYPMRPHQADAVWRDMQEKNTMLSHTVGAGKTLEIACSAMELRRLGLRAKPMVVCPDHMIGQWSSEFRSAYPNAKLLIADDNNWDQTNRRTFINRIATGDWDSIIIRAESFKMIPLSPEYQIAFFEKKIAEYEEILNNVDASAKRTRSVKDLEKAVEKYENKIKELADAHRDEGVIPFDKLGVDHLFIDEADLFKNLEYYTQLQNVRGLGTPVGSERALDMLMKVRHVQENDGGITFATGTPISNTLVECYTMQRFLQPEVLKANGLEAFDEWARQYAETVTQMELNNTGTGYVPVTRFSKIVNVPELVSSIRQTWDIQTAHNLEAAGILVPGVNLPEKKIINEAAPATPLLKSYLKHLEQREIDCKHSSDKSKDNVLSIMTDGRKAAVDMRLINPHLPDDPDSKLNVAVRRIYEIYDRTKTDGYTCAVFFDKARSFGADPNTPLFDGVKDMKQKLVQMGVKPAEIGDVRDCKTFAARQELFKDVNDGKKRIIFGSTETMGAGTNFQQYLKAIVHIDAPWRPRDIEQQNGRGYRPGNKTGELEIYNMVTKGSLDTGLWQVLETKAASIRQVMDGSDKTTRQIDENYFGSVKELSIDNPLMKEAVELDHSIRKLRSLERSHANEVSNACRKLQALPNEVEKEMEKVEKLKVDISLRQPEPKGDAFRMVYQGKEYSERKDVGALIKQEASTLYLQAKGKGEDIEKMVGEYAGMPLMIKTTRASGFEIARLYAVGKNFRYGADIKPESDPVGLLTSFSRHVFTDPDKLLANTQEGLAIKQKSALELEKISNTPFLKADELKTKSERYTEVMKALEEQSKSKANEPTVQNDINWYRLKGMSPDEVKRTVDQFIAANSIEEIKKEPEKAFELKTAGDINVVIQQKFGYTMPKPIEAQIEEAIQNNRIKPDHACSFVESMFKETQKRYQWNNLQLPGFEAIYSKGEKLEQGDILIKVAQNAKPEQPKIYEASRMSDSINQKFLGADDSLNSLKLRVEAFAVSSEIKDVFPVYLRAITLPKQKFKRHSDADHNKIPSGKEDISLKDKIRPQVKESPVKKYERPGMDL